MHLADAPEAGPGEVRHGFAIDQASGAIATVNGVACLTCSGASYFDAALVEQHRVGLDLEGSGALAIGGDTTFVLDRDFGENPETHGGESRPPHYQLFALSNTDRELWRRDLGAGGPWAGFLAPDVLAGPASVVVHGEPVAAVFDPVTGAPRWSTPVGFGTALAADATGGLLVATGAHTTGPVAPEVTLRHFDSEGSATWTTTWGPATPPTFGDIIFDGAARTADGGFLVTGEFTTATLDLGGPILPGVTGLHDGFPPHVNFIAAIDAQGATRWAYTLGGADANGYVQRLKVAASRDVAVVCGEYAGKDQLGLPDTFAGIAAFVARVDASGAITAYSIHGGGELSCEGLAAAGDGSAIVTVGSGPDYSSLFETHGVT
ncbi:MAG TPA: hypothetical protein VF469_14485, partial [Kofleriaceae bacterium]